MNQNMVSDCCSPIICFKNARLIKHGKLLLNELWIQSGKIINPEPLFYTKRKPADIYIDCKKMIIAPGYIDLQINGGFGYDFSTPEMDIETSLKNVSKNLVKHGVTSFCPTIITQPTENYKKLLPKMKRGPVENGASILGVHVEGPFISVEKKGAHSEKFIQEKMNSLEQIEQYYHDLSNVSMITVAPEVDQNDVIKKLVKDKKLVVSLGHSNANLPISEKAFKNGANMITHLFNAMPLFHHRDPGLLGLLTVDSERQIFYGIIADGIHVHYSALRLAFASNRPGMVLVSDAISAAGLEMGVHKIGDQIVEIKDNRAFVAGTNILCGSIATIDHCVRYLRTKIPSCTIVDAIECATLHPAQVLGIEKIKGTLNYDSDADFIILNDHLEILATFVNGQCCFINQNQKDLDINEFGKLF